MITVQIDSATRCLEELKPLFPLHHAEVGLFKDRMPLDPDYPRYLELDQLGRLVLATARDEGRIVGYIVFHVSPHLHYKSTLTGTMDLIWLAPELRGKRIGLDLAGVMIAELQRRGVGPMWAGSKNHKQIEWFWRAVGFEPAEVMLVKWIGGGDA